MNTCHTGNVQVILSNLPVYGTWYLILDLAIASQPCVYSYMLKDTMCVHSGVQQIATLHTCTHRCDFLLCSLSILSYVMYYSHLVTTLSGCKPK